MIKELDVVALAVDLPDYGLVAGDMGTVVYVTQNGLGINVEFFTLDGETYDVVPMNMSDVRAVGHDEISHARSIKSA